MSAISRHQQKSETTGKVLPTLPLVYEPDRWNDLSIVGNFNCYSYALNTQEYGWLSLGGFLGRSKQAIKFPRSEEAQVRVTESLRSELWLLVDGLKQIRPHEYGPHEKHIVAYDSFLQHFYRLDQDGVWSHKPGKSPVTNLDARGRTITDLENADFIFSANLARRQSATRANIRYYVLPEEGIKVLFEEHRGDRVRIDPMPARLDTTRMTHAEYDQWRHQWHRRQEMQMLPWMPN